MAEWFAMGGRGAFVWSAYGITLIVLVANWLWAGYQLRATRVKTQRLAKPIKDKS